MVMPNLTHLLDYGLKVLYFPQIKKNIIFHQTVFRQAFQNILFFLQH